MLTVLPFSHIQPSRFLLEGSQFSRLQNMVVTRFPSSSSAPDDQGAAEVTGKQDFLLRKRSIRCCFHILSVCAYVTLGIA